MNRGYKKLVIAVLAAVSLTASHGLCYAKTLVAAAPACHTASAGRDCCDTSSSKAGSEIKCCPQPAAESKIAPIQSPVAPEPLQFKEAAGHRSAPDFRPFFEPAGFFTTYILQTSYSYHSPPSLG